MNCEFGFREDQRVWTAFDTERLDVGAIDMYGLVPGKSLKESMSFQAGADVLPWLCPTFKSTRLPTMTRPSTHALMAGTFCHGLITYPNVVRMTLPGYFNLQIHTCRPDPESRRIANARQNYLRSAVR